MRHGLRTTAVAVGACALLSGCFGSSSPEPTAAHTRHHTSRGSTPTSEATTEPTTPPTSEPTTGTTGGVVGPLSFSPKSDGRHSHTCYTISGSDPVDYVYYPVLVRASTAVTLTTAAVTYADGVQVAGAWVAPSTATRGTGTVEGWPATDVTQDPNVQWSRRVPAAGADLTPGTWYNVFLHLRVYPDALPLATDGVVLTFTDTSGTHDVTWVDHLTFKTSC
jgi:hypothetical protein